ncbi:SIR2 family NAD-dependent protein deacylase [Ectobacillus panaciterrae]|uniref:SIR2 family NAD-dependent protein deacylase n=1 Tax=Ectobacillus panaciterrae TaxID=363872 RepID=UPI0003FEBA98|nr:NAD-dependent deacylase [Ectobacillus panaciterrae]
MKNWEVILSVAGEGGGIQLCGQKRDDGTWSFARYINELTFDDAGPIDAHSHVVHTWEEALELIESYPWTQLSPQEVHPEFRLHIWKEAESSGSRLDQWRDICKISDIELLTDWIASSRYMVVLTGAGMSTESGVPDFRSQKGLWTKYDPFAVSHIDMLEKDYPAFHEFYSYRMCELKKVQPNDGHKILSRWQKEGIVKFLATQNVENLHQHAGSTDVAQLHGGLETVQCHSCGSPASTDSFIERESCAACGGNLRPNITLFGEMLPQDIWNRTFEEIAKSDLLLIIGTSLQVSPVNQLPKEAGGKVVVLNLDETPFDQDFDLVIRGKAGDVLRQAERQLTASKK